MWKNVVFKLRRDAGLSVVLVLQAAIMFVVAPMAATGFASPTVVDAFRFGLAAAAVLMLTRSRASAIAIGATFVTSLFLSLVLRGGSETVVYILRLSVTTAFDLAVSFAVARLAFGPGKVTVHRIMGGVILYLSIGLIFANAYRAADLLLNPSFGGLSGGRHAALSELLYFSLSTLTTTGFGDIRPLHPFIRSLANLEAVIGQLYPATLLARLVTLHTSTD
ncbi:MAG: ion channel [Caulobacteraceae bacterium]